MTKKKTYVGWWVRDDQNNLTSEYFVFDIILTSDWETGDADIWNKYDKVSGQRISLRNEDNIGMDNV